MSEKIEQLLTKQNEILTELVKESKITNRLLAFINYYGKRPSLLADDEELEFIELNKRKKVT